MWYCGISELEGAAMQLSDAICIESVEFCPGYGLFKRSCCEDDFDYDKLTTN